MIHPYATERYAASLSHIGTPFAVPEWDSVVIARAIGAGEGQDAAGPYPLAVLDERADLEGGLERLRRAGFVSVTLVVDDYHRPPLAALESAFDIVRAFKTHYVVDRSRGSAEPSSHHRYEIKRALKAVRVAPFA